ncbi:MAG: hypothetical protein RJA07_1971 [Bacteroidota bacterium]|jgi:hypothetical protein
MPYEAIPRTDASFDAFQNTLLTDATTNATPWGILAADLTTMHTLQGVWNSTWAVARVKSGRTPADVQAKNTAKANYVSFMRPFIQQWLQNNPKVSASAKVHMGLKPRSPHRTPVPAPREVPDMAINAAAGHVVKISFRPQQGMVGAKKQGKPDGVASFNVAFRIGEPVPVTIDDYNRSQMATRTPLSIQCNMGEAGQRLYMIGWWQNARGEKGPISEMFAVQIS